MRLQGSLLTLHASVPGNSSCCGPSMQPDAQLPRAAHPESLCVVHCTTLMAGAGVRRKLDPDLALKVPWSREEDELLLRLQEVHDNHWAEMAKSIKGRNAQMCRTRCRPSIPSCDGRGNHLSELTEKMPENPSKDAEPRMACPRRIHPPMCFCHNCLDWSAPVDEA